jgi:hypothetical protein
VAHANLVTSRLAAALHDKHLFSFLFSLSLSLSVKKKEIKATWVCAV